MTRLACLLSFMLLGSILVACADPNRVTFVTTTNIAIDADATTQSVSIGYDRYEGYVGPAYETGAVPPIVAKIKSNLSVLNPEVHQFYATGNAAVLATCRGGKAKDETTGAAPAGSPTAAPGEGTPCPELPTLSLSGNKRIMFFGTGSVIGLKVRWAGNTPESVTLGYKRKEFSTLPIGSEKPQSDGAAAAGSTAAEDRYGSVLASLDMGTVVSIPNTTKLTLGQFFATGVAAENLANTNVIRNAVTNEMQNSVTQSLQIRSGQGKFTSEGKFEQPLANQIDSFLFPDPTHPAIIDENANRKTENCMRIAGAPSTDTNDLLINKDFEKFQEPVARCLGLVS
jgi:hypothetical protein